MRDERDGGRVGVYGLDGWGGEDGREGQEDGYAAVVDNLPVRAVMQEPTLIVSALPSPNSESSETSERAVVSSRPTPTTGRTLLD